MSKCNFLHFFQVLLTAIIMDAWTGWTVDDVISWLKDNKMAVLEEKFRGAHLSSF